jgi:hypothetical protein
MEPRLIRRAIAEIQIVYFFFPMKSIRVFGGINSIEPKDLSSPPTFLSYLPAPPTVGTGADGQDGKKERGNHILNFFTFTLRVK